MFRVGDKVWNLDWGWGEIVKITYNLFPVDVEFGDGYVESFTIDGKKHNTANVALFFEEILIPKSALKRPKWRADYEGRYFYVGSNGELCEFTDVGDATDNLMYKLGNYFRIEEDARQSKFYKVFHEED